MSMYVGVLVQFSVCQDLKPENILLSHKPKSQDEPVVVKLADFGLAIKLPGFLHLPVPYLICQICMLIVYIHVVLR
jgi:serine/threonine protein kinase